MNEEELDFGSSGQNGNSASSDDNYNQGGTLNNQDDTQNLDGDDDNSDITGRDGSSDYDERDNESNSSSTGELTVGDSITVGDSTYTIAENGDIVDEEGNVFKTADEAQEWINSVNIDDSSDEDDNVFSIDSLQNALNIELTDEDGNPVEFENTPEGMAAYIDSVLEVKRSDIEEAAVNKLYQSNPLLKQFADYVTLNGTPQGFGEIQDRSNVELDKDNEAQLIAVIKTAAAEFGNKSLNDNYIKYLRDTGGLYLEARTQLDALVEKDKNQHKELERQAQLKRDNEIEEQRRYFNEIKNTLNKGKIGEYTLPKSFIKEIDGRKVTTTLNDFYDYISRPDVVDENGTKVTQYFSDRQKLTAEDVMNRDLIDAWLMFTGGTYKDLVNMAVREEEVRRLRVKANERRSTKTVRVVKNPARKASIDDIIL